MDVRKDTDGGDTIDFQLLPYNGPLDIPGLAQVPDTMRGRIPVSPPLGRAFSHRVGEIAMEGDGQKSPVVMVAIGLKNIEGPTCLQTGTFQAKPWLVAKTRAGK